MGLFDFLKPAVHVDPALGPFQRARGAWRGSIPLEGAAVPLVLDGSSKAPSDAALSAARELAARHRARRPAIERALFEHYAPYAESADAESTAPKLATPADAGAHATLVFVALLPLGGALTTEYGYTVAWDEEHTLGARFVGERFVELNGSVLAP